MNLQCPLPSANGSAGLSDQLPHLSTQAKEGSVTNDQGTQSSSYLSRSATSVIGPPFGLTDPTRFHLRHQLPTNSTSPARTVLGGLCWCRSLSQRHSNGVHAGDVHSSSRKRYPAPTPSEKLPGKQASQTALSCKPDLKQQLKMSADLLPDLQLRG